MDEGLQKEADIVIGARSALFALNRLGVIVIDEEHEDSYISTTFQSMTPWKLP